MRKIVTLLVLAGTLLSAAACVVEAPPPGPGYERWCYYHPYRCR